LAPGVLAALQDLLRRTRDPVAAIAFDAGFNDLSTFNHRFRRLFGAAPTAYRAARPSPS